MRKRGKKKKKAEKKTIPCLLFFSRFSAFSETRRPRAKKKNKKGVSFGFCPPPRRGGSLRKAPLSEIAACVAAPLAAAQLAAALAQDVRPDFAPLPLAAVGLAWNG